MKTNSEIRFPALPVVFCPLGTLSSEVLCGMYVWAV